MTPVDIAVAARAFMDMTFVGLEALPGPGEERFAGDLVHSPGGGAITAIGCARLGMTTALAAPVGADGPGKLVRHALEREGIAVVADSDVRTPVTVVMPVDGERSFVTYDPGVRASAEGLAALSPRAVVVGMAQLDLLVPGARAYVSCGDDDARDLAGRPPAALAQAHAVLLNRREALRLTGATTVSDAAGRLAQLAPTVVVTLGSEGALAIAGGERVDVPGVDVGAAVDTTGAGDLLAAAWAWGEARGLDVDARLRWAVLYAALSVRVPTGAAGAAHLNEFIEEGIRRGLPAPPTREGVHP